MKNPDVPATVMVGTLLFLGQRLYYDRKISKIESSHWEAIITEHRKAWRKGWNNGLDQANSMTGYTGQFDPAKLTPLE